MRKRLPKHDERARKTRQISQLVFYEGFRWGVPSRNRIGIARIRTNRVITFISLLTCECDQSVDTSD